MLAWYLIPTLCWPWMQPHTLCWLGTSYLLSAELLWWYTDYSNVIPTLCWPKKQPHTQCWLGTSYLRCADPGCSPTHCAGLVHHTYSLLTLLLLTRLLLTQSEYHHKKLRSFLTDGAKEYDLYSLGLINEREKRENRLGPLNHSQCLNCKKEHRERTD